MSHFTVLVIGENVEEQMAPHNEELQVAPYDKKCYCLGNKARKHARREADGKHGTVDELRKKYWSIPDETRPQWENFIAAWQEEYDCTLKHRTDNNLPDSDCESCNGTGAYSTTYNPNSKWDWYSIGGRWTGYFKVKNEKTGVLGRPGAFKNEVKFDADVVRKGDVDWEWMVAVRQKEAEESWQNALKDHKEAFWKYEVESGETKQEFINRQISLATYAVVKDGVWYQKGDMGWWGISTNDKSQEQWNREWAELVMNLPDDTLLTLIDAHI